MVINKQNKKKTENLNSILFLQKKQEKAKVEVEVVGVEEGQAEEEEAEVEVLLLRKSHLQARKKSQLLNLLLHQLGQLDDRLLISAGRTVLCMMMNRINSTQFC